MREIVVIGALLTFSTGGALVTTALYAWYRRNGGGIVYSRIFQLMAMFGIAMMLGSIGFLWPAVAIPLRIVSQVVLITGAWRLIVPIVKGK